MKKERLFTPGPVQIPERVLKVLFQILETSMGAYHDYKAIDELCKTRNTLVVALAEAL